MLLPVSALLVVLAAAAQAPPAAPPPSAAPREPPIERMQWSKEVDGGDPITALEVRNDFGDIRARGTEDRRLDASMVVQRLDTAGERVGFTVERRGGVVALVVGYPPGRVRDTEAHPAKDSYDRLDLVVFVPKGVTLRAHTLRGRVEARGLEGDVEASTLDGPLFVRTAGAVQARTDSGELTAMLDRELLEQPGAPVALQSNSGPITLWLPARGTPLLRVETGGTVSASRVVLQRGRVHGRTRAALGPPTAPRLVVVSSRTGAVTVRREEPPLFKAAPGAEKE